MIRVLPVLGLAVFLASCAGPTTPEPGPAPTFRAPVEQPEIAPIVASGRQATDKASREADQLRDRVRVLQRDASDASRSAGAAQSELSRLVGQKAATEAELVQLQTLFSDVQRRNLFLESELTTLVEDHEALKVSFEDIRAVNESIRAMAERKDLEMTEIRQELQEANDFIARMEEDYGEVIREKNATINRLNDRVAELEGKAGEGRSMTRLVWFAVGGIGLGLVVIAVVWMLLKKSSLPFLPP